jgi:hypothetical protein
VSDLNSTSTQYKPVEQEYVGLARRTGTVGFWDSTKLQKPIAKRRAKVKAIFGLQVWFIILLNFVFKLDYNGQSILPLHWLNFCAFPGGVKGSTKKYVMFAS